MTKFNLVLYLIILCQISCISPNRTFEKIPPGIWKAVLYLDRQPVQKYGDDRDIEKKFTIDSELPFNFEVVYDDSLNFHIVIHNADERIEVRDIKFGRDLSTAKDTVIINFPIYDTQIKAIYEDGVMEGEWIVNYKENYRIPFKATHGIADRYSLVSKDSTNIAGNWECRFEVDTPDKYPAVGIFSQKGNKLTGTFLTETGDYRFLEGVIANKKLYLSAFDGAHAFLISGKIGTDGTIGGTFRSGSQYTTNWIGVKNKDAKLKNAYELNKVVDERPLDFKFVSTENVKVGINDAKYKDKYKIIQIMGTWCPNCMDETIFLKEFMANLERKDVAWITLGFERYKDSLKSLNALKTFKSKMNLNHDVLHAGYYDKKVASLSMPQLDKILAYPTLLLVDKSNKIIKIHTGFSGPATPDYKPFVKEWKSIVNAL